MEPSIEHKAFILAGVVWAAFIVAGFVRWPVKMSPIISIGGGFLVACVALVIGRIFFEGGVRGLVIVLGAVWLLHCAIKLLFGR